ncbi:putative callose synthase 8 [Drosera capensis]
MAEVVVSKPVGGDESELGNGFGFTRCIEYGECSSQAVPPEPFDSERIPVDLGSEIRKFLRVANQIENEEPRVAYLCRFHAFVKAHLMDRNSTGRGVRQFKTSLLQRLERDIHDTIPKRTERSDIRELRRVYKGYEDFIVRYIGVTDYANREKLINARAIASALLEVLNAVSSAAGHRATADRERIATESELYVPYNILPLDRGGTHLPIMQIPEIKAACAAVRNVRGLPLPEDLTRHSNSLDIFQWLQLRFGFQTGNVANQREHLILLLSNTHIRKGQKHVSQLQLSDEAVDGLMRKLFRNYTDWCKFLARKSNIRFRPVLDNRSPLLMAYELHSMLTSAISLTSERVMPAYGGAPESFLNNVVCPIYKVIYEEAEKNKNGPAEHSSWRNYDDLNEFFWKHDCFQIGWPMRLDHDFFHVRSSDDCDARKPMFPLKNIREKRRLNREEELPETKEDVTPNNWLGKTNFVEVRSFWQIFRSFDRMWSFLILALQALIIIGCHELSSPLELTETAVVEDVMSIFITSAILKLIHVILDIAFSWKARHTMNFHQILKYVLKLIVAVIWTAILPIYYAQGRRKYTYVSGSRLQEWCSSSYMVAVLVYIMTNAVDVVLFLVPAIGMYIEASNCTILTILSWWTQVHDVLVDSTAHETFI